MTASTHERWEAHVAAWVRSGVTSKEYAVKAGVNPRMWWKSRLKTASASREVTRFVEVTDQVVVAEASTDGVIELDVGGTRILVRGRVDAGALARVLSAVEGRR
mgnify:CR=1 FL=1